LDPVPNVVYDLTAVDKRALNNPTRSFNMPDVNEDQNVYKVVVSEEEQYSLWPADRQIPAGWREDGKQGSKAECLAYIKETWTDMRPKSLRDAMATAIADSSGS
jgi:MbtH protein